MKKNPFDENQKGDNYFDLISLFSQIHHPCCLPLLGFCPQDEQSKEGLILFTEFLEKGSLEQLIQKYQRKLDKYSYDDPKLIKYHTIFAKTFYGVACGLRYLHSKNIVYQDLKTSRILFNIFNEPVLNLFCKTPSESKDFVCTPLYAAPEVHEGQIFESNIFSFGMILYMIFSTRDEDLHIFIPTYNHKPIRSIQELMHNRVEHILPDKPEDIPEIIWDIISQCLEPDPKKRPTADDLVKIFEEPDRIFADRFDQEDFDLYVEKLKFQEQHNLNNNNQRRKLHFFTPIEAPDETEN